MKKLIIIFSFFLLSSIDLKSQAINAAITYIKPRGRLGDQLFCYCKAKWVSYKYNIPLYYKSFSYAEKLSLSQVDQLYKAKLFNPLVIQLKKLSGVTCMEEQDPWKFKYINSDFNDENVLYIIDQCFFLEQWKYIIFDTSSVIHPYNICYDKDYIEQGKNKYQFRNDETIIALKQDPEFIKELRKVIRPIEKISTIQKPEKMISVAVHVRIGGGFDGPHVSPYFYKSNPELTRYVDFFEGRNNNLFYNIQRQARDKVVTKITVTRDLEKRETESDVLRPLKHVPMQFYVDQIKGLSAMLKDVPLFVYIFTDQPNPCEIKKRFKELINKENIIFACREQENSHNLNVLEDLFAMSTFDCLIRPYSSLSQTAQLIGDHKIVITPYHSIWHKGNLIIDEVQIMINDSSFVDSIIKK